MTAPTREARRKKAAPVTRRQVVLISALTSAGFYFGLLAIVMAVHFLTPTTKATRLEIQFEIERDADPEIETQSGEPT